ncbi:MAG: carbohydrate binding family 9 domain-containing protein [Acidobacteriota bacterium]|nr:carbohydrate binding family 9 domain-containing protein [Acidobacteriota bacterium]
MRTRALASFLFLSVVLLPGAAEAQAPAVPSRPTAAGLKVDVAPVLDGDILSEGLWQRVPAAGRFIQKNPSEGAPASERTEVRILYTSSALYVGIICFDEEPSGIIISDARRDSSLDNTDSVRFILDTYHDGQNGFVFGTNPAGLEYDAQVINEGQGGGGFAGQQGGSGGGFNLNWDGAWRVQARVHEQGWSAEFEIPFRTLRYPDKPVQTWGLNVERRIRRRNETAYWAPLPRQFDIARLSLAGSLQALNVPPQRNLKIIPYALGDVREESHRARTRLRGEPGVDLKYSVTPSLTLDATYNTDFAQVEVDEQQVNLDRFNLFFPEKRPFFLENAGLFAVGSPGEAEVFFTRRIGISPDGQAIPIVGGVRLSGQAARGLNIGVLSMQTEHVAGIVPAHNFSVARLRQELPNRSSIGLIAVNRQTTGSPRFGSDYNRSFAADARVGIGRTGLVSGFAALTTSPGLSGDEHAYQVLARRDTQAWDLSAGFTEVGRNFRPEVGFLTRSRGFRKPEFLVFHRYRPRSFLRLQEVRPHVAYRGYWKPDGFQESGQLHIDNHWEFKSGHEVHTGINLNREGVAVPFEIAGVRVPAGTYDHRELQLVALMNEGAPVVFRLRAQIGGFFGGRRVALTPTARLRFSDALNTELTLARNDVDLPTGRFTTHLARARVSYSFTPRTFLQGLLQYNDTSDLWSANVRLGWLQQANTGLFVVYNDTQALDDDLGSPAVVTGRSLTIKFSRMIDLLR